MLLPIIKLNDLSSADATPLASDPAVDAILAVKHAQKITQAHLAALQTIAPLDVSLVVMGADWRGKHPVLTYAVEEYDFLEIARLPTTLYRYADSPDGAWFADNYLSARLHGKGFHTDPKMWRIPSTERTVLARIRTRFGRSYSPAEYVVR